MKKLLLSICLTAASFFAFAQLPTIGVRGGVNFAQLQIGADGTSLTVNTQTLTTYSVGAFIDFKFSNLSFQPALYYTGKGGQINSDQDGVVGKFNLHYLQVPLNLVYHIPVLIGNIYLGAGPYVAYGVSGKVTGSDGTTTESQNVKFGGSDGDFTTTDVGLNGIIGVQFKTGFLIHLNYDLGLTNTLNTSNPDNSGGSIKTRTFGVAIGWAFN